MNRWGSDRRGYRARSSFPDQHLAILVHGQALGPNDFDLQVLQDVIIEIELPFERAIGHASAALEQGNSLVQQLFKGHGGPSSRPDLNVRGFRSALQFSLRGPTASVDTLAPVINQVHAGLVVSRLIVPMHCHTLEVRAEPSLQ